jgi:hypothetical protein
MLINCVHDWRVARCDGGKFFVFDQKPRARIAYDVADLVGGEAIVDWQKHRADMASCKYQFEEGGAVLHQHRDHVVGGLSRA